MHDQNLIQIVRTTPLSDAEIALELMKLQVADGAHGLSNVYVWPVFQEYVNRVRQLNQSSSEHGSDLPG